MIDRVSHDKIQSLMIDRISISHIRRIVAPVSSYYADFWCSRSDRPSSIRQIDLDYFIRAVDVPRIRVFHTDRV